MTAKERVRASAVCVHDRCLLCVRLRDPSTHVARLFVPGGAVEPGETPVQAALRETLEETGYRVRAEREQALVARYPFTWNEQRFQVTTHFFATQLIDPAAPPKVVSDAGYHEGVHWLPLDAVVAELGFCSEILSAVMQLLPHHRAVALFK